MIAEINADAAGTFTLGGDLIVNRMGYGAMRVTGKGIWGPPEDRESALRTLKRVVELGVNFIDTADSYGPNVSEELLGEALAPHFTANGGNVVVATKGGWERVGPGQWIHNAGPDHLRKAVEGSLKRLKVDQIDVYQLHIPDPAVSFDASMEAIAELKSQGKVRLVGLSNVTREHIERARKIVPIVSVQNRYSFADREWDYVVHYCEANGIAFLPWAPIAGGRKAHEALQRVSAKLGATPQQIGLAWLLKRSPAMVPIPGTATIPHLEENVAAAALHLPDEDFKLLSEVHPPPVSYR